MDGKNSFIQEKENSQILDYPMLGAHIHRFYHTTVILYLASVIALIRLQMNISKQVIHSEKSTSTRLIQLYVNMPDSGMLQGEYA